MPPRPAGAPQGMIRAHLATFPPRRRLLRRVVEAILPQVDHLFVVLNEYLEIPGFLRKEPRVTAIIPDRDVKDAGKFWFPPDPGDTVFLIDDDIGYPQDYVARTVALLDRIGRAANVVGYYGLALAPRDGALGWSPYLFPQALDSIRGVSLIGTGTLCASGANIPPLAEMEPFAGYVDHGYSHWLQMRGVLPWVLPRREGWLTNDLPQNLRGTSLFKRVHKARLEQMMAKGAAFLDRWPHAGHIHEASSSLALEPKGA